MSVHESWFSDDEISRLWPSIGAIESREVVGSGLAVSTSSGLFHLKQRPLSYVPVEVSVLAQLQKAGIPATQPILTNDGVPFVARGDLAHFLYEALPGSPLDHINSNADAFKVGQAGADLSLALSQLDADALVSQGLPLRASNEVSDHLPQQLTHRDFHAGNVLFDKGAVSGYLDFDQLEFGPRIVDMVYPATSLLARMFEVGRSSEWLTRWQQLARGFCSQIELTDAEISATADLMIIVQRDFVSWFTSLGDIAAVNLTELMIDHIDQLRADIIAATRRAARPRQVDIMSFNLRGPADDWPQNWNSRRPLVQTMLNDRRPDIIGVQEAMFGVLEDLRASGYQWLGIGRTGTSEDEHCAILWRPEQVTVLGYEHQWLSDTPQVIGSSSHADQGCPRMLTLARFRTWTGEEFVVINTHFDHVSEASQVTAAQQLSTLIAAQDCPVILTGDFNTVPGSKPWQILTKSLDDASGGDHASTFHDYGQDAEYGHIDWVLTRDCRVLGHEIISVPATEIGTMLSDHHPVLVRIELPEKAC